MSNKSCTFGIVRSA